MIQRGKRAELSLHMTAYCVVQLLMENHDEPDYIYKQTSCFACATNSPKPTKDIFALSQTKAVSEISLKYSHNESSSMLFSVYSPTLDCSPAV